MASIFGKDPANQPSADGYARERIEKEIAHLKKPQSTRQGPEEQKTLGIITIFCFVMVIVGLYVLDPFMYAYYKGNAIKAYLYLHNYESGEKARAIAATGILTSSDVEALDHRSGSFQDSYASPTDAEKDADSVINFMNGLYKLRQGRYDDLGPVDKVRYNLFCRWGLNPPMEWPMLNPSVKGS